MRPNYAVFVFAAAASVTQKGKVSSAQVLKYKSQETFVLDLKPHLRALVWGGVVQMNGCISPNEVFAQVCRIWWWGGGLNNKINV